MQSISDDVTPVNAVPGRHWSSKQLAARSPTQLWANRSGSIGLVTDMVVHRSHLRESREQLSSHVVADLNNLKMRKLSTILGIIIVSLLNAAPRSVCYYDDVSRLEATSNVNQADSRLIEPLDNVEVDSLLSSNNNNKDINHIEGRDHAGSSDLSTCQLVQIVHLLRYPGCQPKAIASFACSGSCASYVKLEGMTEADNNNSINYCKIVIDVASGMFEFNASIKTQQHPKTSTSNFWQRERSCSCCQQTGSQEATFALDCPSLDPPYRKVKTHAPIECLCRSCTDLGREDLRPQELVEALSGQVANKLSA